MKFSADSETVARLHEAVNFGERASDTTIEILLLHYTGMNDGQGAEKWLCCEESGVSCHYIIHEDGEIVQMVPEHLRAHHAGAGSWQGREDINSRSIGIEIVNAGHQPDCDLPAFPKIQMEAVAALSRDIINRHQIEASKVLGHSDTAPGRKIDPGEAFDWEWLADQGIGQVVALPSSSGGRFIQLGETGEPVAALQGMLALFGYSVEVCGNFTEWTQTVVTAFQRHYRRSRVDGVADSETIETLYRLLQMRGS